MNNNTLDNFKKSFRIISLILFILYMMFLVNVLFFDAKYGRITGVKGYNKDPFITIKNYIKYSSIDVIIRNVIGNIVAFMPFGFFVPILVRKARYIIIVILLSGVMSLLVEALQYHYEVGSFDVDDIILNTFGGLLGYIAFRICYYMFYGIIYLRNHK